jgi:hypothetical protein
MITRILSLIALGALSGCAYKNLYWGPALSTCSGSGSTARFATGACRSGAEYDIARKKTMHDLDKAATD